MKNNPYFEELHKIASASTNVHEVEEAFADPMNPDTTPEVSEAKVAEEQAKTSEELDEEISRAKDQAEENKEEESKQAAAIAELEEKTAADLPRFGAFAKIIEYATGEESELQKRASIALQDVLSGEEGYARTLDKVASDLFSNEDNLAQLHSEQGKAYVLEKLSFFVEDDELNKVAGDEEGSFVKKVMDAGREFIHNTVNLTKLQEELAQAQAAMSAINAEKIQALQTEHPGSPRIMDLTTQQLDASNVIGEAGSAVRQGIIGRIGGGALLAGGAIYGGKKLYDATHGDGMQQAASEEDDKLLLRKEAGGKLNTENAQEENGGMYPMNKKLVPDFLKIAGAAALIEITNNDQFDAQMRKEASDHFDEIAHMGRRDMDEALIKVAQVSYTEKQLHEIVAGKHTDHLLSKVAFFLDANDMSTGELTKVAGAEGVAAKGVAGALSDAASNITATVDQAKKDAEGAGREYIGDVAGTNPGKGDNSGKGKVGGGLVGGTEGYNVINNPGEYSIEQTAAMLEEAVLAKAAAVETFNRADAFIKHYAGIVRK